MKIAFIFTEEANLSDVPAGRRFRSNFEVLDEVKSLPDVQVRVIKIGELVTQFTSAYVHLDCADLGIKNQLIERDVLPAAPGLRLGDTSYATSFYFRRYTHYKSKCSLVICAPIQSPFSQLASIAYAIANETDPIKRAYVEHIQALADQLLLLLNLDNPTQKWQFNGFDPTAWQQSLFTRQKKELRKFRSEQRKQKREEEKRQAREAKLAERLAANPQPPTPLTHGSGRTVGARPGIYGGVQMRSQLEIRFASELDERGIKWVYEGEALGAASYLVDFYLPDLGVWVEVKGRFEARDRQVLPEIAKFLKGERKHRLLVYTGSGKCCVVNPSGFREVERKDFWGEMMR